MPAVLALSAVRASAQLVYDPFAYTPSTPLDSKVNPGNALPWSAMTDDPPGDDILVGATGMSYTGLSTATGNSVAYTGAGKSERLGFGSVLSSGSTFYSLILQVNDLAAMTATPAFIAGFSNRSGPSDLQPTTVGTRLYLRKSSDTTFNIGVSKNSSTATNIAFDSTNYALGAAIFVVGQYAINGATLGTDDVARLFINPTEFGAAGAPITPAGGSAIVNAPLAGTDLFDNGAPSVAGFVLRQAVADVPGVQVDELRVDRTWAQVTPPVGVSWNADASGNWSDGTKWLGGVAPNNADVFVNFPAVNSTTRVVTVDTPIALRTISFTSAVAYQVAGTSALNFSGSAAINVRAGSHDITSPVTVASDLLIGVDAARSLTVSSDLSIPSLFTKAGAGTLELKHVRAGAMSLAGGMVCVIANGSSAGVSRTGPIEIAPGATLDLRNNDLIVSGTPTGTWNGSAYTGVTALVASGYNAGLWNGSGIVTSQTEATIGAGYTTLAAASASSVLSIAPGATAVWSGQTVTGTDALVMYTYGGDANLSGFVDIDDYGLIDFNTSTGGALKGYYNGDFDYNGVIDIDDYGIIDFTINIQGPPFPTGEGLSISSVPEPAIGCVALVVLSAMRHRRRRLLRR